MFRGHTVKLLLILLILCACASAQRTYFRRLPNFTFSILEGDPNAYWDDVNDVYYINGTLVVVDVNISGELFLDAATPVRLLATDAGKIVTSVADLTTWVAGTSNQVVVTDDTDGTLTLSTPQDIHTGASPTFQTYNATDEEDVLQIDGDTVLRTGASGNNNFFLGIDSFGGLPQGITAAQNEGKSNLGIGFEAGYNNDSSPGDNYGWFNAYIGWRAGKGSSLGSTGSYNTGIGREALLSTISCNNTTAIGHAALRVAISGLNSTAVGSAALWKTTTGGFNTAIGNAAGQGNTTGEQNTIIGAQAYHKSAQGHSNTVIGYQADGRGTASASAHNFSTTIGSQAGYNNITGGSNIYIGRQAAYNQTTNSNLLIVDNQNRGSAAAEITDTLIYGVFNSTAASQTLRLNIGNLYLGNPTHSDADGGGAIIQSFIREDGSGTASTSATITASHDGAGADDTDGKVVFATNLDGTGLVDHVEIDSAGNTKIGDAGTTNYAHIEAAGDTYWVGTAGMIFGEMYVSAEFTVTVDGADANEAYDATGDGWTIGNLNQVTFPSGGTEHYLTVPLAGMYEVVWSLSVHKDAGPATAVYGGIMVDNVAVMNRGESHSDLSATDISTSIGAAGIIDCPNGTEEISLWIINDQSNDVHIDQGTVTIKLVGGT